MLYSGVVNLQHPAIKAERCMLVSARYHVHLYL